MCNIAYNYSCFTFLQLYFERMESNIDVKHYTSFKLFLFKCVLKFDNIFLLYESDHSIY